MSNGKAISQRLGAGDAFMLRSGGGGGFADPYLRPAELVGEDVAQAYVSAESAFADYGVVLTDTGAVDVAATARRRAARGG